MTPNSSSRIKGATAHQPILPSPSKPLLPIYTPPPIVAREDQTLTCPLPILRSNPISIPVRTHRTRSSRRRPTNCHHPLACPICSAPSIDWILRDPPTRQARPAESLQSITARTIPDRRQSKSEGASDTGASAATGTDSGLLQQRHVHPGIRGDQWYISLVPLSQWC